MPGLDESVLIRLSKTNKIITRIPGYSIGEFQPYQETPLFNIVWNGRVADLVCQENAEDLDFSVDFPKLYFPKALSFKDTSIENYPTALGYLLYQVGHNDIFNNKLFSDLDIIKCKKIVI